MDAAVDADGVGAESADASPHPTNRAAAICRAMARGPRGGATVVGAAAEGRRGVARRRLRWSGKIVDASGQ